MKMKTTTDLFNLVNGGTKPVVKFGRLIEDSETSLDRGMYGRIINVEHDNGDVFTMYVDMKEYDEHNDSVAQHNYYDIDLNPNLTAKEAGQYPEFGIEKVYMDYDRTLVDLLEIETFNVSQIVTIKITDATVYQTEGQPDTIIVTLPVPMPLTAFAGAPVQMTLMADEGTGVEYMHTNFGIMCEVSDEPFTWDTALAAFSAVLAANSTGSDISDEPFDFRAGFAAYDIKLP